MMKEAIEKGHYGYIDRQKEESADQDSDLRCCDCLPGRSRLHDIWNKTELYHGSRHADGHSHGQLFRRFRWTRRL